MKRLSFIAVVAALALSLCVTFPRDSFASGGEKKEEAAPEKGGHEGEGKKKAEGEDDKEVITGGRFDGDAIYVHIQPMTLPVVNENGSQQFITVLIDIQVKDMSTANKMQTGMPRVKDALLQKLYGGFSDGSLLIGNAVDVSKLKHAIIKSMSDLVGRENVIDALVQALSQRML